MIGKAFLLRRLRASRKLTRETLVAMAEAEMAYRPTPEQMTFGEQVLHILSCYVTLFEGIAGKGWEWDQGLTLERYPTKAAILAYLDEQTDQMLADLEGRQPDWFDEPVKTGWGTEESVAELLFEWIRHEDHHRGQLVVYLRLKGEKPPKY